jgi:putative PIN family toxin of toxin-antitoxin system
MPRVVLDTNILVSGLGWPRLPSRILDKWIDGKLTLIESPALLGELIRVLRDENFDFLDRDEINEFYRGLVEKAELVEPTFRIDAIGEDDADNRVLECALAGKADYIVTGDKHLLKLERFLGIRIVTARQMADILRTKR